MARKKNNDSDSVNPSDFPKKWKSKLPENWTETAETYSNDDLKKKIVEWEQAISTTEKDMEADADLLALKEQLKVDSEVYKKSIGECQAMIRYAIFLLESRGQA